MSTARKFVDADLRLNPELLSVAIKYLEQYQGEFGFLLDAKQIVLESGSIPLPVARGVLNCMRVDPMVIGLESMQKAKPFVVNPDYEEETNPNSHGIKVVDKRQAPNVPWKLRVPVKVKVPFVMANISRPVLHRVGTGYTNEQAYSEWVFPPNAHNHWCNGDLQGLSRELSGFYVYKACALYVLTNPILVSEKPSTVTYCHSGCFGWKCTKCQKLTTISEGQVPDGPVMMCDYCDSTSLVRHRANKVNP